MPQVNFKPPSPVFLKFFLRFSVSSGSQPPPPLSPKGKRKELEVFPRGPLEEKRFGLILFLAPTDGVEVVSPGMLSNLRGLGEQRDGLGDFCLLKGVLVSQVFSFTSHLSGCALVFFCIFAFLRFWHFFISRFFF